MGGAVDRIKNYESVALFTALILIMITASWFEIWTSYNKNSCFG